MDARLLCTRCGATLAPAWTGPRCPRLSACGKGGLIETSARRPLGFLSSTAPKADA